MDNGKRQTRNINLYKIITMWIDILYLYYFRVSYDHRSYERNHTILFSIDNLTESSVIKD